MARASAVLSQLVGGDLLDFAPLLVEAESPQLVFAPSDFILAHPEGLDLDFDLRPFVGLAVLLGRRAAHLERPAGDRHHVERSRRCPRSSRCRASCRPGLLASAAGLSARLGQPLDRHFQAGIGIGGCWRGGLLLRRRRFAADLLGGRYFLCRGGVHGRRLLPATASLPAQRTA